MNNLIDQMESRVEIIPSTSIRFVAEELRRYGIKTNQTNEKGKTLFYQSAHILQTFNVKGDSDIYYPTYYLVSFKDLFKVIGKNDKGVDEQDIVRIWVIAEKLEKRRIVQIVGNAQGKVEPEERPEALPNVYANLHHIHRNDKDKENYSYKSKFATNKMYVTTDNSKLMGVADYFILE